MHSDRLLETYPIISDQVSRDELRIILGELETLLQKNKVGAIVEFGCYIGTTSLFIQRLLLHYNSQIEFHVYDSFAGLPDKTTPDISPAGEQFVTGELKVSKKEFTMQFKKAGLSLPTVHKGWFDALSPGEVPDNILFAFLDGDYYESIKCPLQLITSKLQAGSVIVVDDYASEALPGAARATNQWCRQHFRMIKNQKSLGIVYV